MNQLLGLLEHFIAVEQFRQNGFDPALALLRTLNPADLPRHYKSALDKAAQALAQLPHRDSGFYLEQFRLHTLLNTQSDLYQRQINPALQTASDTLDAFFLVEKLRYCWAMANFEYILNIQYDWNLGHWLLDCIDRHAPPLSDTARVYLSGIRMVKQPEEPAHFFEHKSLVQQHAGLFPEGEQKSLYTGLLNYCTRRFNRFDDRVFLAEYIEINKALQAAGLFLEEGRLSPWRFLNVVSAGLRGGQTDWTLAFIRDYQHKLPEEFVQDCYLTAMGQYHYYQGEYGQAQVMFNQINTRDVLLALTIRTFLARIYYETGETELLLSHLEAFRIYLLRQELVSEVTKKQARLFVDFTRRLAKIDKPEAPQLHKLKAELPATAEIYHRDWLLEQIGKKMAAWGIS